MENTLTYLAIVLINLRPITSETKLEPVTLSVTEIVLPTGFEELGDGSFFEFHATLNVFNPNSEDFTISHPDTCGFMLAFRNISSEVESNNYQSFACGDAITYENYPSGLTSIVLTAGLMVEDNVTELPFGSYYLSVGLPNWGQEQFSQIYGATILVSEGSVDIIYDSQLPTFSEPGIVPINFNLVLISILSSGLIMRKYKQ